jgi:hypothetical protein
VNGAASLTRRPTITVRLTASEKQSFANLAAVRGISESELALTAIRELLNASDHAAGMEPPVRQASSDRITIRLRPGDRQCIADRAGKRGIRVSRYLATLVRAHVARNPPLTNDELVTLKVTVSVLSHIRVELGAIARSIVMSTPNSVTLLQELRQIAAVVVEAERQAHDIARAALISWESYFD